MTVPVKALIIPTDDGLYGVQANHEPVVIGVWIGSFSTRWTASGRISRLPGLCQGGR